MATYIYNKGSNSVSKSGIIVDAFVDDGSTTIDIEQPANSILTKAIAHVVEAGVSTGSADWGYKVGTTSDDDLFAIDANGFDSSGTGPNADTIVVCIPASGTLESKSFTAATAGTAAPGYTDVARKIRCTATCGNVTSVDKAGKVAFTLFFDILPR
jgi:hypothetical protein